MFGNINKMLEVENTEPLGGGLEARIRSVNGSKDGLERFTIFYSSSEASPITTTYRTWGMPTGSTQNLATFLSSPSLLGIASTSANDTSAGTGARKITIYGLDSNYNPISELITLNGQTKVNSTKQFFRINKMYVEEVGSTGFNNGDIYVSTSTDTFTLGVPQTQVLNAMLASTSSTVPKNTSTFGVFTFKKGYNAFLTFGNTYTDASSSKTLTLQEHNYSISSLGNRINYTSGILNLSGNISYDFTGSGMYSEKDDYMAIVKCSNATSNGSVYYNGFMFKKNDKTI